MRIKTTSDFVFLVIGITITFTVNHYFRPIDEVDLLAKMVHSECGVCTYDEQREIAQVAINRVHSDKFPNTLEEVIYQDNQFQAMSSGNFDYKPMTWKIAKDLLDQNVQTKTLFFCSNYPSWINEMELYIYKDHFIHRFYGY